MSKDLSVCRYALSGFDHRVGHLGHSAWHRNPRAPLSSGAEAWWTSFRRTLGSVRRLPEGANHQAGVTGARGPCRGLVGIRV